MISEIINKKISVKEKLFSLLVDPDKHNEKTLAKLAKLASLSGVDFIMVGGSFLIGNIEKTVEILKNNTGIPIILFPGSLLQIAKNADGILLLSLISGRNPDLLIGNHVIASTQLKRSNLEILPTGYILIDGGVLSSVEYMSNTKPIPSGKTDIVVATAIAGEMLGLKYIYLETGSGAKKSVSTNIITEVKKNVNIPLIVGGGIKSVNDVKKTVNSGADIVVVGTIIERSEKVLPELVEAVKG